MTAEPAKITYKRRDQKFFSEALRQFTIPRSFVLSPIKYAADGGATNIEVSAPGMPSAIPSPLPWPKFHSIRSRKVSTSYVPTAVSIASSTPLRAEPKSQRSYSSWPIS